MLRLRKMLRERYEKVKFRLNSCKVARKSAHASCTKALNQNLT